MKRLLLMMAVALLLASPVFASTVYRGESSLYVDTVWSGEVFIDGILTVPPEVTLEIRPGTTVRFTVFDSNGDGIGEHELFIQGRLLALGTAEAPVRFTSAAKDPQPGDWGAINIMASTERENRLQHCRVEYGYRGFHAHFSLAALSDSVFTANVRGLQFQESTLSILRCQVKGNGNGAQFRNSQVVIRDSLFSANHWGLRGVYSDLRLEGSRIEGNLINGLNLRMSSIEAMGNTVRGNRRGIYLQGSEGRLQGNLLQQNSEHGILLEDSNVLVVANIAGANGRSGVKTIDATGRIEGNDLSGNGEYALYNEGASPADARGNWWGEAGIAESVFDGADRKGLGRVDYRDPLPAPPLIPNPNRSAMGN